MMEDIQLRQKEEKEARSFFMPFEAELNYMRTVLEWYENRLDKKTSHNDLTRIFELEWKELQFLDREQSMVWMHLLPFIRQKRNDLEFLGQLLTILFKIPVQAVLNTNKRKTTAIDEKMLFKLGQGALGINSIIGSSFDSHEDEIQLLIGPAATEHLVHFIPGTAQSRLIDLALSCLVPVETEVKIELITSKQDQTAILSTESDSSLLGFTVYI